MRHLISWQLSVLLLAGMAAGAQAGWLATARASPEIPDVAMMLPSPPTDQELAGDSLHQFVAHHATVHHFNTGVTRNLAH